MIVGISIINIHVLEKPSYVFIKETLDFAVVELRVNEESANVGLHNVRESLKAGLAIPTWLTSLVTIPWELSLSKSNSLVTHWRQFPPL